MLESEPSDSVLSVLDSVSLPNDTPAHCKWLAVIVSIGNCKCKEAVGVPLTRDSVKKLSEKDVKKYNKRYSTWQKRTVYG